jgi:predicted phosphodiesterase
VLRLDVRFLILSDIHANWEALDAVIRDAEGQYDAVLCLGDLVGYGPDPNKVTAWVRQNVDVVIRGNHDKACSGLAGVHSFNEAAQCSSYWTRQELLPEHTDWLSQLPRGPIQVETFELVHGSPDDEDRYMFHAHEAELGFRCISEQVTFFGHTHVQGGFICESRPRGYEVFRLDCPPAQLAVAADRSYLINPGAVGQPRDGDSRAAYCIYDASCAVVEFRRVLYDIRTVQEKILCAMLPEELAFRLAAGA